MIFYLSYFIQSERVHNIIISLILIFIMICKYVKSNLSFKKKKIFDLFHPFSYSHGNCRSYSCSEANFYIRMYIFRVQTFQNYQREETSNGTFLCRFLSEFIRQANIFRFYDSIEHRELIKIFISNLLIIALNHFIYFEIEYEINFVGILHSVFLCLFYSSS